MQGQVQMLHVGSQTGVGIMTRNKHLLTEFLQLDYKFHFKNTSFAKSQPQKEKKQIILLFPTPTKDIRMFTPGPRRRPSR